MTDSGIVERVPQVTEVAYVYAVYRKRKDYVWSAFFTRCTVVESRGAGEFDAFHNLFTESLHDGEIALYIFGVEMVAVLVAGGNDIGGFVNRTVTDNAAEVRFVRVGDNPEPVR